MQRLGNTHCTEPTTSWCDDGSCAPCETNPGCAHLTATPVLHAASGELRGAHGDGLFERRDPRRGPASVRWPGAAVHNTQAPGRRGVRELRVGHGMQGGAGCAREVFEGTELGHRCFGNQVPRAPRRVAPWQAPA